MLKRILPFVPLIFILIACSIDGQLGPADVQALIHTLTATMWTPLPTTPTATPEPKTGRIVDALNSVLIGADPLGETIAAKYSVIDVLVVTEPPNNLSGILRIHVDCEWIYSDSCTLEDSFVRVMNVLRTNDKVKERISENVPLTTHTLQVVAFDRMIQKGMIAVPWQDASDYMNEKINGNQLGARIVRMVIP